MTENTETTAEVPAPEETGSQETSQTTSETPEFNLRDLSAVKQIIEVGARRGAWNAAEMSTVGFTYDRLTKFLNHHIPSEEQPAAEEAPTE